MKNIKLLLVALALVSAPAMAAEDGIDLAEVGKGTVHVAGEVAKTIIVDIPVGLTRAAGKAIAWSTGASDPRYRTGTWTWGWL